MRQTIMQTYKELKAIKENPAWPSNQPSMQPDPAVMDFTNRHGRKEGLLYNNRLHWMGRGDGTIQHTGLAPREQYDINRTWILENFKE